MLRLVLKNRPPVGHRVGHDLDNVLSTLIKLTDVFRLLAKGSSIKHVENSQILSKIGLFISVNLNLK